MTNTCKNCAYWTEDGECEAVDARDPGFGWRQNPLILFEIAVTVADDTNLHATLKTGPDFGCIRFKPSSSDE